MLKVKFSIREVKYIAFLLYAVSTSAFELGTGFDAIFTRASFIFMLVVCMYSVIGLRLKLTLNFKWCVVFWSFYYLSLLWAHNVYDTLGELNNSIQIIGMVVCMPIIIQDSEDIDRCMEILVFAGFVMVIRLIALTPIEYFGTERIGSEIGIHSNGVGHRMAILVSMSVYLFGERYRQKHKITFYGVLCIIVIIIFSIICMLTGSKGSILKLVVCVSMYILINSKGPKVLLRLLFIIIAVYGLFWLIMNNDMLYDVLGNRLESLIKTVFMDSRQDGSTIERAWYIEQAKEMFRQHPILGYGGNNFQTYLKSFNYSHIATSHNGFYELLSTLGIVGFIIYYSVLVRLAVNLIKKVKKSNSQRDLLFVILIIVLLVNDYIQISYATVFSQTVIAVAFMAVRDYKKQVVY